MNKNWLNKLILNLANSKTNEIKIKLNANIEFFFLCFSYLIGCITFRGITLRKIKNTNINKLNQVFRLRIVKYIIITFHIDGKPRYKCLSSIIFWYEKENKDIPNIIIGKIKQNCSGK